MFICSPDFCFVSNVDRAAELDDVLLQAIWRRPRGCLRELMQNARTKAAAGGYKKSVAEVIEEELLAVLEPAMNSSKGSADTPGGRRNRNVSGIGAALGEEYNNKCILFR